MSAAKPEIRELWFYERTEEHPETLVAKVQIAAARIVQVSNYADAKDKNGKTVCTVTWPSPYKVKVI